CTSSQRSSFPELREVVAAGRRGSETHDPAYLRAPLVLLAGSVAPNLQQPPAGASGRTRFSGRTKPNPHISEQTSAGWSAATGRRAGPAARRRARPRARRPAPASQGPAT